MVSTTTTAITTTTTTTIPPRQISPPARQGVRNEGLAPLRLLDSLRVEMFANAASMRRPTGRHRTGAGRSWAKAGRLRVLSSTWYRAIPWKPGRRGSRNSPLLCRIVAAGQPGAQGLGAEVD